MASVLFSAPFVLAATAPTAQTPATPHAAAPAHKAIHPQSHSRKGHPAGAHAVAAPAPETPKAPEPPKWPAIEDAAPASVVWDSQGLRIDASNSSLHQILKDVETATGAEVVGMGDDQRVFGAYGPGLARDVLYQLLQGSGYNVLMVGDLGKGAPRQIVLSSRKGGDTKGAADKTASTGDDDTAEAEPEEPPQQQPVAQPIRPGFGPGGLPRSPQQIMQEMQQRQLQLNQQQGQPPQPPPPQ